MNGPEVQNLSVKQSLIDYLLPGSQSFGQNLNRGVVRVERLARLDVRDEQRERARKIEQQNR